MIATMKRHEAEREVPRVWVGCWAAYNAGHLHGRWVDLEDADADDLWREIAEMLRESPVPFAEEWGVFDHEGFHGLIGESSGVAEIIAAAEAIVEHGPAFAAYGDVVGEGYATREGFEEAYRGTWDSEEAYAEELFDELHADCPEELRRYIDIEAFSRDLFGSDLAAVECEEGGVHVFDRN